MASEAKYDSRRILVTGGAGLIGSHLCSRLLAMGHQVYCLDNFSTSARRNLDSIRLSPNFHLIEHDVTVPFHFQSDYIFNLACPASPIHYQSDPVRTTKTSILGAINVLELARHTAAVVLQSSTSEIYGDPVCHPQPETYWGNVNPIGPRSCYDEGKRCAESLFFDYRRQYGIRIKVARIFNTYGPHMCPDDGRVVSTLLVQALQNQPLTVFGNGQQTRSFCYVDDLVEGLIRLMFSPAEFTGPVNLGNPEELTVMELIALIRELTDSRSPVVYRPLPQDDPRQRRPDISLAAKQLGWRPAVSVREGLTKTVQYYEELLQQPRRAPFGESGRPMDIPSLSVPGFFCPFPGRSQQPFSTVPGLSSRSDAGKTYPER